MDGKIRIQTICDKCKQPIIVDFKDKYESSFNSQPPVFTNPVKVIKKPEVKQKNKQKKEEYFSLIKLKAMDSFSKLNNLEQVFIMEIVAQYHYRTGVKQKDGSMGEIVITLNELNNTLAYCYLKGKNK
jgi:membrane-anchored protein YejM (alkaline phosphatase superfamily)